MEQAIAKQAKTELSEYSDFSNFIIAKCENNNEVSLYSSEKPATAGNVMECVNVLSKAFPLTFSKMSDQQLKGWAEVLFLCIETKRKEGDVFSEKRIKDAIVNFISSKHSYGEIQISDLLTYDKKIKLYSYAQSKCGLDRKKTRTYIVDFANDGFFYTDADAESIKIAKDIAIRLGTYRKSYREAKEIQQGVTKV